MLTALNVLLQVLFLCALIIIAKKLIHVLMIPKDTLKDLSSEDSGIGTAHGMRGNQTGHIKSDKRVNSEAVRSL